MQRLFWSIFFILFIVFLIPPASYLVTGLSDLFGRNDVVSKLWFTTHILSGILVYSLASFQFSASLRKKKPKKHRFLGKVYIISSIFCILTLFFSIIPHSLCKSCIPSQYVSTTLWLVFIVIAFYFIKKRKKELHRRFMISGFICAAYFVTIRIVTIAFMGFFRLITPNEHTALLISDFAVWLVPLIIFWAIWLIKDFNTSKVVQ